VLDVGCGEGAFLAGIQARFELEAWGIDISTPAIDMAARLVEPALMILIGLVIGAIVVLMYMPIFDLATSLQ
jgi:methylase of polypeptide subunit release factors